MFHPDKQYRKWLPILACPACKQPLQEQDDHLYCEVCMVCYAVQRGRPILMNRSSLLEYESALSQDGQEMVAQYLASSRWSKFLEAVKRIISVDYIPQPPDVKKYLHAMGPGAVGLEVGSGSRRFYPGIINLDIGLFPNVDLVADGANLPFQSNTLDYVILDVVLEHVKYPQQFLQEARRTLKKGGILYMVVPFVHPYHSYPADYHRFSKDSLILLAEGFEILEMGVLRGPMVAILNCLTELPFIFSFSKSQKIYQITKGLLLLLIFYFKYLDKILIKNPQAHRLAHSLYLIGRKG